MMASRSMRRLPRTDCSASMLWGGSRSMTLAVAATIAPLAPSRLPSNDGGERPAGAADQAGRDAPGTIAPAATGRDGAERSLLLRDRVHLLGDLDPLPALLGQGHGAALVVDEAMRAGDAALVDPVVPGSFVDG